MTEFAFGLVSGYGILVIMSTTYLSCLGLPVPTAFIMLAGGAFAASGDLPANQVVLAALVGAVLGDQTGFVIGRLTGRRLAARLERSPSRAIVIAKARHITGHWGGAGVFFTRWLLSPLGPYVNLLTGAASMEWARFTIWGIAGEVVWVAIYVGLGYAFSSQIGTLAALLGNSIGFLTAGAVSLLLGLLLLRRARTPKEA